MTLKLTTALAMRIALVRVAGTMVWRWLTTAALNLSQPIRIHKRRYWRDGEMAPWLEQRKAAFQSIK